MSVTTPTAAGVFAREAFGTDWAALDLVNSEQWDGFGRRTDHLDDAAWLADFAARWGWRVRADTPTSELRALRAALRRLVEAVAAGSPPDAADLAALDVVLAAPARRRLRWVEGAPVVTAEPLQPGWPWAMAEIAASAGAMLAAAPTRIKLCANLGCRWAFHDRTRGNTRRWCNDLTCGNRDKVRRFRERARARTPAPAGPRARGRGSR
jgi:predicted RNA-binding Zn ribbon-like protein